MEISILLIAIVFLSILLLSTLILLIWYSGLLDSVSVGAGPPPCGQVNIMYKYGTGPYKNVGNSFTEVTCLAPTKKCFGIYYDDPNQVAPNKLRWAVGCVLTEGSDVPDPELIKEFEAEGYKEYCLPAVSNAVIASFPYRSQLSVFVGLYKAYPQMAHYIKRMRLCAHPFIDLYTSDTIHCYAPLSKQECFYVPETDPNYVDPKLLKHTNTAVNPEEGMSGVTQPAKSVEEDVTKEISTSGTPKPSTSQLTEGEGQGDVEAMSQRSSAQRVPEMTDLNGDKDSVGLSKSERVVPGDHQVDYNSRASMPVIRPPPQAIPDTSRAKSVNVNSSLCDSTMSEPLDTSIQDDGVTSTMSELSQSSFDTDAERSVLTSPGTSSSYLSSDHSYSSPSDYTDPSDISQSPPLVELSSDSDTDKPIIDAAKI